MLFIGIDVAKATFIAAIHKANGKHRTKEFPNNIEGFRKLASWSRGAQDEVAVAMESTGRYEEPLANFCFAQGWQTFVLNPRLVALFSRTRSYNKTDRTDAASIEALLRTQFSERRFRPYQPPTPLMLELRAMTKRLTQLKQMLRMETNRLEASQDGEDLYREGLARHIAFLREEHARTEQHIARIIKENSELNELSKLLQTVPGCGPKLAYAVLAEFGRLEQMNSSRAWISWLGLAPRQFESGSSVRGKPTISKRKGSHIRAVLYMAANSARRSTAWTRWNAAHSRRKTGKKLTVAAMDKLARILFGVLKHRRPFDPNLAFPA